MKVLTKNGKPILVDGKMITVDEVTQISDVTINGESIVVDGLAEVPIASGSRPGVVKTSLVMGTGMTSDGAIVTVAATDNDIKTRASQYRPIVPATLEKAVTSVVDIKPGESKQVTFVEPSDIQDIKKTFIATYGVTTYEEIKRYYDLGYTLFAKQIISEVSTFYAVLSYFSGGSFVFTSSFTDYVAYNMSVNTNNVWATSNFRTPYIVVNGLTSVSWNALTDAQKKLSCERLGAIYDSRYKLLSHITIDENVTYVKYENLNCKKVMSVIKNAGDQVSVSWVVNDVSDTSYVASNAVIRHSINTNYTAKTIIDCEDGYINPISFYNNGNRENGSSVYGSTKIMEANTIDSLIIAVYQNTFKAGTAIDLYGIEA